MSPNFRLSLADEQCGVNLDTPFPPPILLTKFNIEPKGLGGEEGIAVKEIIKWL